MKKAEESSFSDTENNVTETRNIRLSACRWRQKSEVIRFINKCCNKNTGTEKKLREKKEK